MPLISLFCILILHKLLILFINGVISQVSILVGLDVLRVIVITRKPRESLVINIDSPRVHGCYHHVDPHIELQSINQKGIVDVPTDDVGLINWHLGYVINYEYTLALARVYRLYNPLVELFFFR